jgi:uncharacterized membrane protein
MDAEDWLPWLGIGLLASFAIAIEAMFRSRRTAEALRDLREKIYLLENRLLRFDEWLQAAGPAPAPEMPRADIAAPQAQEPISEPQQPAAEPPEAPEPPAASTPVPGPAIVRDGRRLEQLIVENWLVWLGGVALALGGAFLVKLSIDYGWLTPAVRVVLGVALGFFLSGAAEWVVRRDTPPEGEGARPSYIPQTLAAAGCATVFASLYAAYQLYALLPSFLAFPLLAATAAATVALSLRHGPFVAALGLVGAFAVPLLVQSDAPSAFPLFAYLALVSAGSLAVLQYRAWPWLAWIWLGGAVFWVLLWLAAAERPETPVVGGFLLIQFGLFAAVRHGIPRIGFLSGAGDTTLTRIITESAFWVLAVAMFALVHADNFSAVSLICAIAAMLIALAFAYRDMALDRVIGVAGALPLALLASWNLPSVAPPIERVLRIGLPDQVEHFAAFAMVSAALLGGLFLLLPRVARPGRWAALSAAAPPLMLAIAYWRLRNYGFDIAWSAAALALAAVMLGAAASVAKRRTGAPQIEIALASYAIAVLGGTILAATCALPAPWLSVALALHLPALGWVEGRIRLPMLRRLALGVAGIVLVRLVLNPFVLQYPLSATPIFNWLLYGYGVPTLAFIVATRQFGSRADDLLVTVLEAGAILFGTLFLTLETRHFFYGRIDAPLQSLARDSVQIIVWLALAWLLLRTGESRARPVLQWGGIALFALGSMQAVLWEAIIANPLATGAPVGRLLVLDALSVAYAIPALLYAGIAVSRLGPPALQWTARGLAIGFALLWLTLETRHAFQGEVLAWGRISDAEWYAYSTVWLAFAGIILAISLYGRNEWLRRAALAGIGLVAAKVFLSDMAALEGVLRALSFLGLGGALMAIGYAYRRLRPLRQE